MRLATFNLESFGGERAGDPDVAARIDVLKPQIERLRADILCFQEVNGQRPHGGGPRRLDALDDLVAGLDCAGFHRVSSGDLSSGAADVHNLVVLSRHPIASARALHHDLLDPPTWRRRTAVPPDETAGPVMWDRPMLEAEIALPDGRSLHLFNVHLRAPLAAPIPGGKLSATSWARSDAWAEGFALAAVKRLGQAVELRLAIDAIFDANDDALIAAVGDFNADALETPLRIAIAGEDDTGNGDLAGRSLTPVERSVSGDRRYTVLHHGRPLMLDHVLISRALLGRFDGVEIHNETLTDELVAQATGRRTPESHHAPVVARFVE
ncbi:endonuclease/exonuclease/phosphatase family metal-dependent hydrolase [Rhodobium orientis]|uniref:Endonuclease n=1 Tax=Rhodobium orientis TaxID=34017 RepID=A0A327JRZ1_9HYPH|nr:endonuclease/exonuclease/phosphatase family protein [Rhodobium orientis]MBB4304337.1 endonuclease/exonuclease/phosphatase family metal-dependent hydrolase [Rhodobium orientis]MBK5948169.1 endonuclease [Rhodobium orientis]RAI28831.1 endonuclease [Rhodobium orientis]